MPDENGFNISVDYPDSIKRIRESYSTKISISRIVQKAVFGPIGVDSWTVSVYIISDVCRVCGLTQADVGSVPERERCLRHAWDHAVALLLFSGVADTVEEAMKAAGDKAERFNKNPKACHWRIEGFQDRRQYLEPRSRMFNKG